MKCDEILPLLEPFLDRECSRLESRLVKSHLDDCSRCLESLRNIEVENHFYSQNAERIDVPESLWAAIVSSTGAPSMIEPTPLATGVWAHFGRWLRGWRLAPLPALAIMVLAIGLTVSVMKYLAAHDADTSVASVKDADSSRLAPPTPASHLPQRATEVTALERASQAKRVALIPPRKQSASELVREAEAKYLAAIAILQRDAVRHRAELDVATWTRLEQTIANVDLAIASTRKAVQQAPSDPVAVQYMLAAYSRKVDLLRQMVGE